MGGNVDRDMSRYEQAVRQLYQVNMFHPAKMGLRNTHALHEALGSPMQGVKAVHIAGTNGKGSVAFKMSRALSLAGQKTGLFVSPHIACFRERMQVDGRLISEADVSRILPHVFKVMEEHAIPATFFEVTTALAFCHFAEQSVDMVVLETGLGGRLDATNIITPVLSIITSIGLEHTRILGDTLELIAREKGGIIKPGVPVLVGDQVPMDVLRGMAEAPGMSAPFYTVKDVLPIVPPLEEGNFDAHNSAIAEAGLHLISSGRCPGVTLELSEDCIKQGTAQRPPCRFEEVRVRVRRRPPSHSGPPATGGECDVPVVLDVAHNPPAIQGLFQKLQRAYPGVNYRVVAGFSEDKDVARCLKTVLEAVPPERLHLVQAAHPRASQLHVLEDAAYRLSGRHTVTGGLEYSDDNVRVEVRKALEAAAGAAEDEVVVICGTFFLMADARQELGFDEPTDSPMIAAVAGSGYRGLQDNMGSAPDRAVAAS